MNQKKLFSALLGLFILFSLSLAGAEIIPVTLSDEGCTSESGSVVCDDQGVTITEPGEYMLSGTLSNGRVLVDCAKDGKVILHLNNAVIHNETSSAILIGKVSPRVRIALTAGSENRLTSGEHLVFTEEDEPNGVIFSRSDLTIEGSGILMVSAGDYDGIVSKDDLRIEGGEISIQAVRHGIRGKDSVEISDGNIVIRCGKDGLRATNTKDSDKGFISISGGKISIVCGDDPLDYVTGLSVTGGTIEASVRPSGED